MMAVIPMVMTVAESEVTLTVPPLMVAEERRETRLPVSPGRGAHGSPSWSELEGSGGDVARPEVEHPPVSHRVQIAEIPTLVRQALGWSRQPSLLRRSW